MHDWLEQPAIGFGEAAGNFQTVNVTPDGYEGDAVQVHTSFGADTAGGLPAPNYRNNASMATPADGYVPDMRTFLWGSGSPGVFGGADAVVVLHEYTHGLSNRLVIDGDGVSTLSLRESRAMGEGWSDWYALDDVVANGFGVDDPATPGGVRGGPLLSSVRTQPVDCPVATAAAACPGTPTAGPGGADAFAPVTIPLYCQGHVYRAGSRLRLTISAPNGDQPVWAFGETDPPGTATVAIARAADTPSRLLLPVVPGVTAPAGLASCPGLRGEPCRTYDPAG
jgi:hypothetical protein